MTTIVLTRRDLGAYTATTESGLTLDFGGDGELTSIELLLAALAGCTATDVDHITSRRCPPESFEIEVSAQKAKQPNRLEDIEVTFRVRFADGEAGDAAREVLPRAVEQSHERLCTVSQTIQRATPVATRLD